MKVCNRKNAVAKKSCRSGKEHTYLSDHGTEEDTRQESCWEGLVVLEKI